MDELDKQASILFVMIAFIVLAAATLFFFDMLMPVTILLIILITLIIIYSRSSKFFTQLEEYERAVVFHMGKFKKIAGPGWLFVIPFIEFFTVVDLRVRTLDIKPQDVITKDNIKLTVDAIIYMKVADVKSAILNVENYEKAMVSYVQANIRDVIGKVELESVISNVSKINEILEKELQKVGKDWGIKIVSVELQSIELPKEVIAAMHKRRAAKELKYAQAERAEARKITIDAVQEAAGKLTEPTLQYMYLQALERMAEGKSTKIIFPMELSKIAAGIADHFGVPYAKAQDTVAKRYETLAKQGKKPKSIIETLRKEVAEESAKKKLKK